MTQVTYNFTKNRLFWFKFYSLKIQAKLETCVSNDFAEKIEEVTRNFAEQILKVKNELEAAKETNQLNMLHFNGEIKKVKTELQSTKESLRLKTAEHNAEIKNLTSDFHGELKIVKTKLEKSPNRTKRVERNFTSKNWSV